MNDNLKKYSFCDLLKQGKIRIPKIQRDYAQGRLNPKVVEIRKAFVHTLLLVVTGKQPAAKLDFIYGSDKDNAFEPYHTIPTALDDVSSTLCTRRQETFYFHLRDSQYIKRVL